MVTMFLIPLTIFLCLLILFFVVVNNALRRKMDSSKKAYEENMSNVLISQQSRDEIFQLILDNVPVCILVKDMDEGGKHILWNKELERHTGIPASEIIGKTDAEIEPWPGLGKFIIDLDNDAVQRGCVRQDMMCPTASGKNIYYRTNKMYIKTKEDKSYIVDACVNLTDEWKLRQQNAAIIESQQVLLSKYELISDCLAYVSGEMDSEKSYSYILQRFGESQCAVHAYVATYDDPKNPQEAFLDSCWVSHESSPLPPQLNKITLCKDPVFYEEVIVKQHLYCINQGDITGETSFKEWHRENSIGSIIFVPIFYRGQAVGLIGMNFHETNQVVSQSREFVIRNVAHFAELAYARRMAMAARNSNEGGAP